MRRYRPVSRRRIIRLGDARLGEIMFATAVRRGGESYHCDGMETPGLWLIAAGGERQSDNIGNAGC